MYTELEVRKNYIHLSISYIIFYKIITSFLLPLILPLSQTLTLTLADNSSSYLATYSEKSTIFAKFSEICKEMSEKESGGRGSGDERIAASFHRLSDIGGQLGGLHGELGERLKEFWENDIRDQYRYIVQVRGEGILGGAEREGDGKGVRRVFFSKSLL